MKFSKKHIPLLLLVVFLLKILGNVLTVYSNYTESDSNLSTGKIYSEYCFFESNTNPVSESGFEQSRDFSGFNLTSIRNFKFHFLSRALFLSRHSLKVIDNVTLIFTENSARCKYYGFYLYNLRKLLI